MTFTLLWALMLNGQEVVAYTCSAEATPQQADTRLAEKHENKTVVKQKVSLEGTTSFVALNLQQAVEPLPHQPVFANPTDILLPAYTTIPPSVGFLAQIFPITIQPNAP
ncbi:RNA methyltransferase [Pontibacter cellulosilyticus]|uniref:RNA methyltransferase n=1 Tax=Pontibacter cellulosilyticus TaxID=1720253 RepID=A0A923SIR5_9BACT|nr:RNA methyltransferase [Pontibacter cellulosilyticus]MBC5993023.1 RNA methyltransferase [Pontibacter cellulosilyticus]